MSSDRKIDAKNENFMIRGCELGKANHYKEI